MDTDEETSTFQQPNITTEMWGDIFTTSSDEEPRLSETVDLSITQAHRDPLEECMDGVEAFVHELLKTGKVTVTGDAGGKVTYNGVGSRVRKRQTKIILQRQIEREKKKTRACEIKSAWRCKVHTIVNK